MKSSNGIERTKQERERKRRALKDKCDGVCVLFHDRRSNGKWIEKRVRAPTNILDMKISSIFVCN